MNDSAIRRSFSAAAAFAAGGLASLFLAAASAAASPAPSPALARVNGEAITAADLRAGFLQRHGGHEKFLGGDREVRSFLNVLIDERLLVQEAYRLGLQDDPEIRKITGELEDRKVAERLIKAEIEDKGEPTSDEIRNAWEKHTSELLRAREIVVDAKGDADWVYLELLQGGDFDALARRCSAAESRIYGGAMAPIGWGAMEPEWEAAVLPLEGGELTAPFETPRGWTIVELLERMPVPRPALAEATKKIEGILKQRRLADRTKRLDELLWSKFDVRLATPDLNFETLQAAVRADPDSPIATWRGGKLSLREFVSGVDPRSLSGHSAARLPELIREQLHVAVNRYLVILEGRARKYDEIPEIHAAVRAKREDLMLGSLYANNILTEVKVTDDEVRKQYDRHATSYFEPEKLHVAQILFKTEAEAKAARTRIEAGEAFGEIAKKQSLDRTSAEKGGDLGTIAPQDVPADLRAVLAMKAGEISQPLKTNFGYHLFRVIDIAPKRPLAFDDVKESIRKSLTEAKERERRAYWVDRLRKAATIKLDDAQIRAFLLAEGSPKAPKSH